MENRGTSYHTNSLFTQTVKGILNDIFRDDIFKQGLNTLDSIVKTKVLSDLSNDIFYSISMKKKFINLTPEAQKLLLENICYILSPQILQHASYDRADLIKQCQHITESSIKQHSSDPNQPNQHTSTSDINARLNNDNHRRVPRPPQQPRPLQQPRPPRHQVQIPPYIQSIDINPSPRGGKTAGSTVKISLADSAIETPQLSIDIKMDKQIVSARVIKPHMVLCADSEGGLYQLDLNDTRPQPKNIGRLKHKHSVTGVDILKNPSSKEDCYVSSAGKNIYLWDADKQNPKKIPIPVSGAITSVTTFGNKIHCSDSDKRNSYDVMLSSNNMFKQDVTNDQLPGNPAEKIEATFITKRVSPEILKDADGRYIPPTIETTAEISITELGKTPSMMTIEMNDISLGDTLIDRRTLLCAGGDGYIYKLDLNQSNPTPIQVTPQHEFYVTSLGIVKDPTSGEERYISTSAKSVYIWDAQMQKPEKVTIEGSNKIVSSAVGLKDGWIACVDRRGSLFLIDPERNVHDMESVQDIRQSKGNRLSLNNEGQLVQYHADGKREGKTMEVDELISQVQDREVNRLRR